jgi:hypothetical protein
MLDAPLERQKGTDGERGKEGSRTAGHMGADGSGRDRGQDGAAGAHAGAAGIGATVIGTARIAGVGRGVAAGEGNLNAVRSPGARGLVALMMPEPRALFCADARGIVGVDRRTGAARFTTDRRIARDLVRLAPAGRGERRRERLHQEQERDENRSEPSDM